MSLQPWNLSQQLDGSFGQITFEQYADGAPLMMTHGTPFSSFVWRRFVQPLARHFRVTVYNLVGYGQSEQLEGQDVSLGIQSGALAKLLAYLQIERPIIIAHDFGGATTLRAHSMEGWDFRQMIRGDPVAIAPWGSPFVQHVRRHFQAFEDMPPYIHDGILNAYIRMQPTNPCLQRRLPAIRLSGFRRSARQRSIARLRKWIRNTRMRSNPSMQRFAARWRSSRGMKIAGFRWNRGGSCTV